MIELVEAKVLAEQMKQLLTGKKIQKVITAQSPHKFAWYHGDPQRYDEILSGKTITGAVSYGGQVELNIEDMVLLFSDGVNLLYHEKDHKRPNKHQLLIEFTDDTALSASVQMYGGLCCFLAGTYDNSYYIIAKEKPSPLSKEFDRDYYNLIYAVPGIEKLSAKAFLATEQRIPGLGNGILQDILFNAGIHPRKKVKDFTGQEKDKLYTSIRTTLNDMLQAGGRDTEKNIFGNYGGYRTKLSKNTVNSPCPVCGSLIQKEAYLGGSIYYCSECQK